MAVPLKLVTALIQTVAKFANDHFHLGVTIIWEALCVRKYESSPLQIFAIYIPKDNLTAVSITFLKLNPFSYCWLDKLSKGLIWKVAVGLPCSGLPLSNSGVSALKEHFPAPALVEARRYLVEHGNFNYWNHCRNYVKWQSRFWNLVIVGEIRSN